MTARDFILVGSGVVIGYLLVGIVNKKEEVFGITETVLPDASSLTIPPAISVEKDKI